METYINTLEGEIPVELSSSNAVDNRYNKQREGKTGIVLGRINNQLTCILLQDLIFKEE